MSINLDVRVKLSSEEPYHAWLCFKHAVRLSLQDVRIDLECGDWGSDYYIGPTYCSLCEEERTSCQSPK